MRVTDLIPNPQALLTREYWRDRAAIVSGRATEYPVRKEIPEEPNFRSPQPQTNARTTASGTENQTTASAPTQMRLPVRRAIQT